MGEEKGEKRMRKREILDRIERLEKCQGKIFMPGQYDLVPVSEIIEAILDHLDVRIAPQSTQYNLIPKNEKETT